MPSILLLSGGPAPHDASWAHHVAAPLLMSDTPAANRSFMDGHEVTWLVYRPAYVARWRDDLVASKAETERVQGAGAADYVDLLRRRAGERGWTLRFIDDAASFWTQLAGFEEPVARLVYWGHADGDLWLAPGQLLRATDLAEAVRRDPRLPWRFRGSDAARPHQFVGSDTSDFARAWSKQLAVWSQGVTGRLDWKAIHTGGGLPAFIDRSDVRSFDATGAERGAGRRWGGGPKVLIDPGHGGHEDVGRSSAFGGRGAQGTLEKDVTLDVARRVAARLGGNVQLTRAGDQNLPLGERAQQAARAGADVFVSIHADSGRAEARGAETWVHPEAGADSRALALGIQRSLDRLGGRYGGSGSTLEGRLAVLTPAVLGGHTSACLVEIDTLSSPRGEARLRDPAHRQAIGDAIAGAIQAHLDR